MKRIVLFTLLFGLAMMTALHAQKKNAMPAQINLPEGVDQEKVRDAGNQAISKLLGDFFAKGDIKPRAFAVLPLQTDIDGTYFTDRVRDKFTQLGGPGGFQLFTRTDADWDQLLTEIGWGQKFEDTMNAESVQKFGRIQGVQGLITGRVVSVTSDASGVKVRMRLRAFEVETGQVLWGDETTGTFATPPPPAKSDLELMTSSVQWWYIPAALVVLVVMIAGLRAVSRAARPR